MNQIQTADDLFSWKAMATKHIKAGRKIQTRLNEISGVTERDLTIFFVVVDLKCFLSDLFKNVLNKFFYSFDT